MNILRAPEISREDKLLQHIVKIALLNEQALNLFKGGFEESLRAVWENKDFTPQEVFDFHGNQAYKLFEESDKVIAFIKTYEPDYFPAVNIRPYQINEDGTVTVLPEVIE